MVSIMVGHRQHLGDHCTVLQVARNSTRERAIDTQSVRPNSYTPLPGTPCLLPSDKAAMLWLLCFHTVTMHHALQAALPAPGWCGAFEA